MMARELSLKVTLGLVDKALGPIKAITKGSGRLAEQLKASRDQMKSLNQQQRDISAYRLTNIEIAKQARAMKGLQGTLQGHEAALAQTRTAHERNTAAQKTARTEYNKLAKALIQGKGNTAEFRNELEKARIRLSAADSEFVKSQKNVKTYKDRVRHASDAIQQMARQQQASQGTLSQLKTKLESAGISTSGLGKKARTLRTEQDRLNATLEAQRKKLAAVTRQQERLSRAKQQYQKTQSLAGSMAGTGAAGLATGSGILYAGARLIAPGIEFGAQMSELQAVTRLDKGDERFAMLKQQARDLGASTAFSGSEVGAGQTFLARAGFTPEAINASMQDVLNLALANGVDLARTADIASNISSAFKIDPEVEGNITRVADVLSGTAARANVNLEMLGDTMKYMGSAEGLGLSLEQAAAMAGLLGNIGIQSSQAGTTMRAMLNRLSAPVGAAKDSIEELGLTIADAQGNMRGIPDILGEIAQKTKEMGNVERAAHLKAIFGEEAGSGMSELINQKGLGGLDTLLQELKNVAGENAEMARIRADNIDGDLKGLRSAWEEVGNSLTDVNEGPLRETIQSITGVTRSVGKWIQENPALVAVLAKTAAGLGILIAAGGAIALTLASILGPIAMVRYAIMLVGIATSGALLPVLAVIAAIAALAGVAYLIYKNWDPIKVYFVGLWDEAKTAFDLGIFGIMKLLLNWSPFNLLYKAFVSTLEMLGIQVPEQFKTLGGAIIDGLLGGLFGGLGRLKDGVMNAAGSMRKWFAEKLDINSPSRVFAELGGFTMEGLTQGLAKGEVGVLGQITHTAKQVAAAGAITLGVGSGAIAMDNRPPLSAASTSQTVAGAAPITIHVHPSAGMDEHTLARLVAAEVAKVQQRNQVRSRSALSDQE